jgi:hypothetical protein
MRIGQVENQKSETIANTPSLNTSVRPVSGKSDLPPDALHAASPLAQILALSDRVYASP